MFLFQRPSQGIIASMLSENAQENQAKRKICGHSRKPNLPSFSVYREVLTSLQTSWGLFSKIQSIFGIIWDFWFRPSWRLKLAASQEKIDWLKKLLRVTKLVNLLAIQHLISRKWTSSILFTTDFRFWSVKSTLVKHILNGQLTKAHECKNI